MNTLINGTSQKKKKKREEKIGSVIVTGFVAGDRKVAI
jgi:hypothetical protein